MSGIDSQAPSRFDIYSLPHKGIRAALAGALAGAGRLDWRDHEDTAHMVDTVRELATLCRVHLAIEERFIHPAMEARRPGSAGDTADEHRRHLADIDRLEQCALELSHLPALRREITARDLYRQLAHFTADNLRHMDREESVNARVLWETHDDAELVALHREIVGAQTPGERRIGLRWMLPHMTPAERATLLGSMRAQLPAEAFDSTLAMTLPLLDARDAAKLRDALGLAPGAPLDYVGVV